MGIGKEGTSMETKPLPEKEEMRKVKEEEGEEEDDRGTWSGTLDFLMSALSFAVGMGNLWRFPYLCYRNGGGAFLIPYLIMVVFAGFPLIFMELSFGQFGSLGVVEIWKACPLFQGIGWTMFCISFFSCMYYNMLIAYSFFYTFASFAADVPWRNCGNWWNTEACGRVVVTEAEKNCTVLNGTWYNTTCYTEESVGTRMFEHYTNLTNLTASETRKSPSDEYFHHYMLNISEGFHDMGLPRWQLVLCLLLCWSLVFVCLSKGIKSSGKATYVTSTFPYVILLILFVRGLTLEGSSAGIMYYLTPEWSRLLSAKVWADAAVQVFFSMSCSWGGLITLASYNKFNNNCLRDAIVVSAGDCLTSIFGGVVIFSIIGYMANQLGVPVSEVATQGAGLAYIVYPEAVTMLPISPLWAVLFMLMLINLGIGTQFTLVTTAHTTLLDVFSKQLRHGRRPLLLLLVLCLIGFTVGIVITTNGGIYVLQLLDSYCPSYALLVCGLLECVALGWVYGLDRFFKDIERMLGSKPSKFWIVCWKFVTPTLILFILLFTMVDFKRTSYGNYTFPAWADAIGFLIVIVEVAFIPGLAIYKVLQLGNSTSLWQRVKYLCKPAEDWGPSEERTRQNRKEEARVPLRNIDGEPQVVELSTINPSV